MRDPPRYTILDNSRPDVHTVTCMSARAVLYETPHASVASKPDVADILGCRQTSSCVTLLIVFQRSTMKIWSVNS